MRDGKPAAHEHTGFSLPRTPMVYLVGIVALFSMVPEGAVLDWAAVYLRQEMGTDLATAGFAFAGFSGARWLRCAFSATACATVSAR